MPTSRRALPALALTLFACDPTSAAPPRDAPVDALDEAGPSARVDASPKARDAAETRDAVADAAGDAGIDLDGGTTLVVMEPTAGAYAPTTTPLQGPGAVLMGGGTDVDAAFVWMHDTIAGSATAHEGNLVVLRADSKTDNTYTPYIYALAPYQSVMTIYLAGTGQHGGPPSEADLAIAAYYIDRSDVVFFAGGDQADYVQWNGSPLMASVTRLYARGGVVGGTSAGCSIQGPFVFDSVADDLYGEGDVTTAEAVKDPFAETISFTVGMLETPTLGRVMTDPHFVTRDRLGRLAAFVARQYADGVAPSGVLGVGVDESNALLVDKTGLASLVQQPHGTEAKHGTGAYFLLPRGPAKTCEAGDPLDYEGVKVVRVADPKTDSFDFASGCGTGETFSLDVRGATPAHPYTPKDPYTAAGKASSCP